MLPICFLFLPPCFLFPNPAGPSPCSLPSSFPFPSMLASAGANRSQMKINTASESCDFGLHAALRAPSAGRGGAYAKAHNATTANWCTRAAGRMGQAGFSTLGGSGRAAERHCAGACAGKMKKGNMRMDCQEIGAHWFPLRRHMELGAGRFFQQHQWSSGRIHRCHRCDPGSIPG